MVPVLNADFTRRAQRQLPRRRVFLVTEPALRARVLDAVRDEVLRFNDLIAVASGLHLADTRKVEDLPESRFSAALGRAVGWPEGADPGVSSKIIAPEVVLRGEDVYVTIPDAAFLRGRGGDHARLAEEIARWSPCAGLLEMRKNLFGPDPRGIPRVHPGREQLRVFGLPPPPGKKGIGRAA